MIVLGSFAVRYWKVILPIAGACVLVGAFYGYGAIKYRTGYKDAQEVLKLKIETMTIREIKNAGQDKEKIKHVEENMDNSSIDNSLRKLGIMRADDNR